MEEVDKKRVINLSDIAITKAKIEDSQEVFDVVNEAYLVEFTKTNRYLSLEEATNEINESLVVPDGQDKPRGIYLIAKYENRIVASIRGFIERIDGKDGEELMSVFGPLAVSVEAQGCGIGSAMMEAA